MTGGPLFRYAGFRIVADPSLEDSVIDWSRVRAPSRALRRQKNGKRKSWPVKSIPRTEVYRMGDSLIMHPATAEKLRKKIEQDQLEENYYSATLKGASDHGRP